jgi:hypothetical protein
MKAHYSPGPWMLIGKAGDRSDSQVVDDCGRVIANCGMEPSHQLDDDEAMANAMLIAAAPGMVAVLASCITDDAQGVVDRGNGVRRLDHITQIARYAIRLAQTGESKDKSL